MTIVGYDYPGELSLICGLLLVHGFDIIEGQVFTYEPLAGDRARAKSARPARQALAWPATAAGVPGGGSEEQSDPSIRRRRTCGRKSSMCLTCVRRKGVAARPRHCSNTPPTCA